jgi:hypothetical protein
MFRVTELHPGRHWSSWGRGSQWIVLAFHKDCHTARTLPYLSCSMYCLFLCCSVYCLFLCRSVLFVCKCVLYKFHRVATQLQLINISNHNHGKRLVNWPWSVSNELWSTRQDNACPFSPLRVCLAIFLATCLYNDPLPPFYHFVTYLQWFRHPEAGDNIFLRHSTIK